MSEQEALDQAWMQRALDLAQNGAWSARPNPMVGCVLVRNNQLVGEGWHQRKGGPHAEIVALATAGECARGATAYVTLEPCAHTGRTGPCTQALIAAGVSRVVAAMRDPFAQVNGAGLACLQAAGISVSCGMLESQARALNAGYLARIERRRPWLRLKLASSLDGRTALANGESKWITGAAAREDVMRWRARAGAILTGSGTVLADDPQLTVRLSAADNQRPWLPPLRVVLDSRLSSLHCCQIRNADAPTLYIHAPGYAPPPDVSINHTDLPLRAGKLDLSAVLSYLAEQEINEIHVEAGARLAGALLRENVVDEVLLYIAPVLLGEHARPLFSGLDIHTMAQRFQLEMMETLPLGEDIRLRLRPKSVGN